jgi:acetyl-CoA carboxylase carboxyl transferase subunit beta
MNWITNMVRPKISTWLRKKDTTENLWIKCPKTGEMVFHRDLENSQWVVPSSGYHMRIGARLRFEYLFDNKEWEEIDTPNVPVDPLKFRDQKRYSDRLKEAREKTKLKDCMAIAVGGLDGRKVTAIVQDFAFMGGSLGMAAGEAFIKAAQTALERRTPLIAFTAAGGARMQEGILSLMQMPRTTVAVQALRDAGLPYIVVLTDPTTGGVTASYAMLGDVHLAEPGALIGFAGPRVIEQTIRERLPEGFQRSEYLLEHGMVDMVVHRHRLRETLSRLVRLLTDGRRAGGVEARPQALALTTRPAQTPARMGSE